MSVVAEMTLAEKLYELRSARGLTQQQLATRAGLTVSTVAKIEYGGMKNPAWSTMRALARALAVSLEELNYPVGPGRGRGPRRSA